MTGPSRANEAQADPPCVDHNAIALLNKLRSDFAVSLTLISDGDFVAQLQSKDVSADPVHNNGQGALKTNVIATIHAGWQTYIASQAWADFALEFGVTPGTMPALPVAIEDIDFPLLMDEEYKIVMFSLPHQDEDVIKLNSALIFDFCKFAFAQPMVFHYDLQGRGGGTVI